MWSSVHNVFLPCFQQKISIPRSENSSELQTFTFYLSNVGRDNPQGSFDCIQQYITRWKLKISRSLFFFLGTNSLYGSNIAALKFCVNNELSLCPKSVWRRISVNIGAWGESIRYYIFLTNILNKLIGFGVFKYFNPVIVALTAAAVFFSCTCNIATLFLCMKLIKSFWIINKNM